jgi:hypothetical protein
MMPPIRAGSEVAVIAHTLDELLEPPALATPNLGVFITFHPPSGTSPVIEQAMLLTSVGRYTYRYQGALTDVLGVWTMEFKIRHNTSTVLTQRQGAWVMVA